MFVRKRTFVFLLAIALVGHVAAGKAKKETVAARPKGEVTALLWRDPADIGSRNLFYGAGGEADQPHGTLTFVKEDLEGSNPKFVVKDESGVKWKVKLGREAQPETAASRFVWAAGYFTGKVYYFPVLQVKNMQPLKRGNRFVSADGAVRGARLKREEDGWKKVGIWQWGSTPFDRTTQLNGLRVIMALINNWDLKDTNNGVYEDKAGDRIYLVSDLGATFATTGFGVTQKKSKGNLKEYSRSKFIQDFTADEVDFNIPTRPTLFRAPALRELLRRLHMREITRHVPRGDVRWMGDLLGRLSPQQIRDAFRAAGYAPEEVEGFARVVERRIAQLSDL